MSVTIFTMTHKKFPTPGDPIYVPVQVGRARASDLGYIGDDTGVSISEKNCYYGELTGVYWVWKNIRTSDYVGICHYRRYFCTEEGRILTEKEYEEILSTHDIITSKLLKLNFTYYEGYAGDYNIHDLETVGEVIRESYPAYYGMFEKLVHDKGTYFGNMMVCKKEIYDAYCEWLFDIFEKAEERIDASGYDDYHKRVYGFISEFLLYVWTKVQGLKVYECKVGMTDEKRETAEIKERLAEYFAKKDIAGAKTYMLACLEKRPDVLMEASDITGELKMSMQVIAVCELEKQAYGSSTIDRIQDFGALMAHFQKLNDLIQAWKEGETEMSPSEVQFYLKSESITDIALEASARLFYPAAEASEIAEAMRGGEENLKVLFLDIDGVLNSNFWNDSHQTEISDGTLIDEEKVKLLARLVKETNSEIILHSGWRFWFDSELKPLCIEARKLVELLEKENLCINGVTPDLTTEEIRKTKKFSSVKADEILLWLNLHHNVSGWVVLDDLDLHNAQIERHQVKTDQTVGLTLENVKQAVKILAGCEKNG